MKRIVMMLLCMHNIHAMYISPISQRYAFNAHDNFGKRHFIVGCDSYPKNIKKNKKYHVQKNKASSTVCYFTSTHDVRKEIAQRLREAQKSISIAIFTLTDAKIADQLIKEHASGVKVSIVTDKEQMRNKYSKIKRLVEQGIPVRFYNCDLNPNIRQKKVKDALMHHKFIVIDDNLLIVGSLNLTKSGQESNIENITITTKQQMIADYSEEFKRLLSLSSPVTIAHLE